MTKICDALSTFGGLVVSRYLTHLLEPNPDKQLLIVWFSTHRFAGDDAAGGWSRCGRSCPYDPPKHSNSEVCSSLFSLVGPLGEGWKVEGWLSVSANVNPDFAGTNRWVRDTNDRKSHGSLHQLQPLWMCKYNFLR